MIKKNGGELTILSSWRKSFGMRWRSSVVSSEGELARDKRSEWIKLAIVPLLLFILALLSVKSVDPKLFHDFDYTVGIIVFLVVLAAGVLGILKFVFEIYVKAKEARQRQFDAEERARSTLSAHWRSATVGSSDGRADVATSEEKMDESSVSREGENAIPAGTIPFGGSPNQAIYTHADLAQASLHQSQTVAALFDLYNKQIDRYQTLTQNRAALSFLFAIGAMAVGLLFVFYGGYLATHPKDPNQWAPATVGALLSGMGGAISTYISKTFLDVHRLSLLQLNHYFQQPVINSHVLVAQRIADAMDGMGENRKEAYVKILDSVVQLIQQDGKVQPPRLSGSTEPIDLKDAPPQA
jgi:uncharacterized integral membrane protein